MKITKDKIGKILQKDKILVVWYDDNTFDCMLITEGKIKKNNIDFIIKKKVDDSIYFEFYGHNGLMGVGFIDAEIRERVKNVTKGKEYLEGGLNEM